MGDGAVPRGLKCPRCGFTLQPVEPAADDDSGHRLVCHRCAEYFRAHRRRDGKDEPEREPQPPKRQDDPKPVGDLSLRSRSLILRCIARAYPLGVFTAASMMIPLGGFVPVLRGWMRDEVTDWGDVLETLGGVRLRAESSDPDADLGPVLVRLDAPTLFSEVAAVSRKLNVKPPDQIRLAYLPCCGVVGWRRTRILLIGLPLLQVLNIAEFRAVLAHELAHLALGDVAYVTGTSRFVETLGRAVERSNGRLHGPLGLWAKLCWSLARRLDTPIARGQEARADRTSAMIAGGGAAASALVKVAMVQPLFREVLDQHDPEDIDLPNLYAHFRAFWRRLPNELREAMRLHILVSSTQPKGSPHPPLPDRVSVLQTFPEHPEPPGDRNPASTLIGDLEAFEQLLHNRLFGGLPLETSVFHRNRG